MRSKLIIGTRSSKLALWQANYVKEELVKLYPSLEINLKEIKTKGDHITDVALSKVGGKGLFTKEIEDELLRGDIDLAAHSLKDLPTKLPDGLKIGAVLKREKPHDVLLVRNNNMSFPGLTGESSFDTASNSVLDSRFCGNDKVTLESLPSNSTVGTSSLRRIAQLKAIRGDLQYLDLRGNLDTRIKKLEDGQYDAIVLAYAGVKRLGFENKITEHFNPQDILPACGQGALAIEIRESDKEIESLILKLNDKETYLISLAERAFLETLQGGCQVPIGVFTEIKNNSITMYGMIASLDGKRIVKDKIESPLAVNECINTGKELAHKLLQNGGKEILTEINAEISQWHVSPGV